MTFMHLQTVYLSIFSIIFLLIILFKAYNRNEKGLLSYDLFIAILLAAIGLIIIDLLSWAFNGKPGLYNYILNHIFNISIYIVDTFVAALWLMYCHFQIYRDEGNIKRIKIFSVIVIFINAAVTVGSLKTGWFFTIDENNIYQRGTHYWYHVIFGYSFIAYAWAITILNRRKIERDTLTALLFYPLPQIAGGLLQSVYYGLSLSASSMALSILIVYFNIQDRALNYDYLTGAYNRRQMDFYLQQKIKDRKNKAFSAIFIDINDFKLINDNFGHYAGDRALQDIVNILRSSIRDNDFIARYGGDEFLIILDVNQREALQKVIDRINANVDEFNRRGSRKYEISLSMGWDIFNLDEGKTYQDFLKHIDALMYVNKKAAN